MNVSIRKAVREDVSVILELIRELARFEKAENQVLLSEWQLAEDGFGENPAFECLLAFEQHVPVGFCLSWYRYSTWRGKLLYVEDLFVREDYRRKGIGKLLLDEMIKNAESQGIKYIHLQVLDWNIPGISFYKKHYPAEFDQAWINVLIPVNPQSV